MFIAGLTGGAGSGKSTVAEGLARHGAEVIDADVLAREVVALGTPGLALVVERFGSGILGDDGVIDRAALAERVFGDGESLAALNAIVHPLVRVEVERRLAGLADHDGIAVLMVPLFVESGHYRADALVVVDCPQDMAVGRLVKTRGWTEAAARRVIAAQGSREQRLDAADFVIDNSGSFEELDIQIEAGWHWIRRRVGANTDRKG